MVTAQRWSPCSCLSVKLGRDGGGLQRAACQRFLAVVSGNPLGSEEVDKTPEKPLNAEDTKDAEDSYVSPAPSAFKVFLIVFRTKESGEIGKTPERPF